MRRQQLFIATVMIATLSFFNNCGSSKVGSSTQASRSVPVDDSGTTSSSGGLLSQCNVIPDNTMNLEGPVSSYLNTDGNYVTDLIRIKFNSFPTEIFNSSKYYVQFFPWHEDTPGSPVYSTVPLDIYFVKKNTAEQLQDEPVNELSMGTIENLIDDNNFDISMNQFFNGVIMILDGVDLKWDAITIALYDEVGGQPIDYVNVLLPAFDADPNSYALDHTANALRELHPWWDYRNSGYSESQFYTMSKNLCSGF